MGRCSVGEGPGTSAFSLIDCKRLFQGWHTRKAIKGKNPEFTVAFSHTHPEDCASVSLSGDVGLRRDLAVHSWSQWTPPRMVAEWPVPSSMVCFIPVTVEIYISFAPPSLQLRKLTVFGARIGQPLAVGRSFPSLGLSAK